MHTNKFQENQTQIQSRKTLIPAKIITPDLEKVECCPLVVMAHGLGGSKDENGGFTDIAMSLAKNGIASIRIDFPGCDDSTETFADYTIRNMLADIKSAKNHMLANYPIDKHNVGLFGYSMGGRMSMLSVSEDSSYKSVALLAPACQSAEYMTRVILGGDSGSILNDLIPEESEDNSAVYDLVKKLGLEWVTDLQATDPLESFGKFAGDVLVIYGDKDVVVSPVHSLAAAGAAVNNARSDATHLVKGADHGYGFGNPDESNIKDEVIKQSVAFFKSKFVK